MENSQYVVEMLNITKRFKGIVANDNITIQLKRGEIHALLGENGAGKSTLMSVLFGLYKQEEGIIKVNGKEVNIDNPNTANELGIGMVHQHFKLVHNFTALENIMLGVETVKHGILQVDDARKKVMELSKTYGLEIYPDSLISDLTVGMQQRVEILKMLYRNNNILIFDEPTAVLTPNEIEELMKIMKSLVKEGKSILFITHKLNEIKEVADRCSVLRKGKYIGTIDVKSTTKEEMSEMMVGRKVSLVVEKTEAKPKDIILSVKNLNVKSLHNKSEKNIVKNVSFDVHAGEIVCIAGIDGNGQSELVEAITGLRPIQSGSVSLCGMDITHMSIKERNESGIGHIPEDRRKHGLVSEFTVAENAVLKSYFKPPYTKYRCMLDEPSMKELADNLITSFDIRAGEGSVTKAGSMSGGNQQKVIIAREIELSPDVLVVAQPTRGLDVGAIEYIRRRILEERDKGRAVLLISFELDEIMNLCDRIATISKGTIVGIFNEGEVTEREIGIMMAGSKHKQEEAV